MKRFRRLGVFMHDSPADDEALAFASRFAELAESESVLCVHVRESGEAEAEVPDVEEFQQRMLKQLPPAVAQRTKVEWHTGTGIPEILRCARDLELDLIVVGRRLPSEQLGIGSAFSRLARKAPCNVLVVPNQVRTHLSRLLVPVDFSRHSRLAFEQALAIARASGDPHPQVVVQSVYSVGYGYKKFGISLHEAGQKLEAVTHEKLAEFVQDVDTTGVEFDTVCTCAEQIHLAILDLAAVRKMDMILVGSRGLSGPAATLLGSQAERLLVAAAVPVLVVKEKGETTHLLNALLGA
ncbi:MAG: universal stress protein [Planctomycetota bacterium]